MDQRKIPLYEALKTFVSKKPVSFHVPGHKNGTNFPHEAQKYFHDILSIDVTELTGLDDLHSPFECIEEAQRLLAELYEVQKSYFLINGSTAGNLAMLLACCNEHDIILVQRNAHKSIMNGLKLTGARPVFLEPWIDEKYGVPVGVPYEAIEDAILQYPQTKALILTHPNYYGMGVDLEKSIALAHKNGIPVLVDEAHGAHFCIGEPFPTSALTYGADIVVHSAHKTLPAMTMGSYLHVNSSLIDEEKVSAYLNILQSSSPSYPIMASLDIARFALAKIKEEGCKEITAFTQRFSRALNGIPQLVVLDYPIQDALKVTVQTRCKLSGYELQRLFEEIGMFVEMADPYNVLLILPLQVNEEYIKVIDKLQDALCSYDVEDSKPRINFPYKNQLSSLSFTYKQLEKYKKKVVPLRDALGMIAAEMIIPYPPGIPLVMYGEEITLEHIKQISDLEETGARFQGNIKNITVFDI